MSTEPPNLHSDSIFSNGHFVIRLVFGAAVFVITLAGLTAMANISAFAVILSLATSAPVFLSAVLFLSFRPPQVYLLDVTALGYTVFMAWTYFGVRSSDDPLRSILFLIYPVYAIVLLTLVVAAIGIWQRIRRRSSDDPGATG